MEEDYTSEWKEEQYANEQGEKLRMLMYVPDGQQFMYGDYRCTRGAQGFGTNVYWVEYAPGHGFWEKGTTVVELIDPVPDALKNITVTEIGAIEDQIARIEKEGINTDEPEDGPFALYDAVAANRMVDELKQQIEKIRERNVEPLADILVQELLEKADPVQAIQYDMGEKVLTQPTAVPVYESLEQILQDMIDQKRHLTIMEKLHNTISTGAYINHRPTE